MKRELNKEEELEKLQKQESGKGGTKLEKRKTWKSEELEKEDLEEKLEKEKLEKMKRELEKRERTGKGRKRMSW